MAKSSHIHRHNIVEVVSKWTSTERRPLAAFLAPLLLAALLAFYCSMRLIIRPTLFTSPSSSSSAKGFDASSSRIAVCLVGGARRFELTAPSLVRNLLEKYPNAELFLHSPLDTDSYKLALLKDAPRIAAVRIFEQKALPVTEPQMRVLTADGSPNGIQGLLQYFNLVEGCLTMIKAHESNRNFTYDWIIRTRVDGFWSAPLDPTAFRRSAYVVPSGSSFGGLNDRLGVGDRATSELALPRLSILPLLDAAGSRLLNSESAFRAHLQKSNVRWREARFPFCVVSDRLYSYPPGRYGVPVAAMGSGGALSGAKCRPCEAACAGKCVETVAAGFEWGWNWIAWRDGNLQLCNAQRGWERGWEDVFDRVAGEAAAAVRRRVAGLNLRTCVEELEMMRTRAGSWEAPSAEVICRLGLAARTHERRRCRRSTFLRKIYWEMVFFSGGIPWRVETFSSSTAFSK